MECNAPGMEYVSLEMKKIEEENKILKSVVKFLLKEVRKLQKATAGMLEPIPLEDTIKELTKTAKGKKEWEKATKEIEEELKSQVKNGEISEAKYKIMSRHNRRL